MDIMQKKIDLHKKLLDELHQTYIDKNHDYGDSVGDTYKAFGMVSFATRLSDKLNRVKSLLKNRNKVTDESMRDTLIDMANYAILAVIEMDLENEDEASK